MNRWTIFPPTSFCEEEPNEAEMPEISNPGTSNPEISNQAANPQFSESQTQELPERKEEKAQNQLEPLASDSSTSQEGLPTRAIHEPRESFQRLARDSVHEPLTDQSLSLDGTALETEANWGNLNEEAASSPFQQDPPLREDGPILLPPRLEGGGTTSKASASVKPKRWRRRPYRRSSGKKRRNRQSFQQNRESKREKYQFLASELDLESGESPWDPLPQGEGLREKLPEDKFSLCQLSWEQFWRKPAVLEKIPFGEEKGQELFEAVQSQGATLFKVAQTLSRLECRLEELEGIASEQQERESAQIAIERLEHQLQKQEGTVVRYLDAFQQLAKRLHEVVSTRKRNLLRKRLKSFLEGMGIVEGQMTKTLKEHGISLIVPEVGSPFNPLMHRAIGTTSGDHPGTIAAIVAPGYTKNGRIICTADVTIFE